MQKLENNEPRPIFTGSYKKEACTTTKERSGRGGGGFKGFYHVPG